MTEMSVEYSSSLSILHCFLMWFHLLIWDFAISESEVGATDEAGCIAFTPHASFTSLMSEFINVKDVRLSAEVL